ncbi:MAG: RnfABCDGE type electron transport complex subunit B [Pseudomonadota bacterium]|nr:RnfABCDGE type electron transport complex subunit B [Pseudomonadota bacterium]
MLDALPEVATPPVIARIDEATCIGCTLCIRACPTDAIVGAAKLMHTVVAARCIGCRLCLPPCPVDCIAMMPSARVWNIADGERAREHFAARNARLASASHKRAAVTPADEARRQRRAAVGAALARARSRRAARSAGGA